MGQGLKMTLRQQVRSIELETQVDHLHLFMSLSRVVVSFSSKFTGKKNLDTAGHDGTPLIPALGRQKQVELYECGRHCPIEAGLRSNKKGKSKWVPYC